MVRMAFLGHHFCRRLGTECRGWPASVAGKFPLVPLSWICTCFSQQDGQVRNGGVPGGVYGGSLFSAISPIDLAFSQQSHLFPDVNVEGVKGRGVSFIITKSSTSFIILKTNQWVGRLCRLSIGQLVCGSVIYSSRYWDTLELTLCISPMISRLTLVAIILAYGGNHIALANY